MNSRMVTANPRETVGGGGLQESRGGRTMPWMSWAAVEVSETDSRDRDLEIELIWWCADVGKELMRSIKSNFPISACHLEVLGHQAAAVLEVQHQFPKERIQPQNITKSQWLHSGWQSSRSPWVVLEPSYSRVRSSWAKYIRLRPPQQPLESSALRRSPHKCWEQTQFTFPFSRPWVQDYLSCWSPARPDIWVVCFGP